MQPVRYQLGEERKEQARFFWQRRLVLTHPAMLHAQDAGQEQSQAGPDSLNNQFQQEQDLTQNPEPVPDNVETPQDTGNSASKDQTILEEDSGQKKEEEKNAEESGTKNVAEDNKEGKATGEVEIPDLVWRIIR